MPWAIVFELIGLLWLPFGKRSTVLFTDFDGEYATKVAPELIDYNS